MIAAMFQYVCPTCGKEVSVAQREDLPSRPFCCERCKLVDLHKWFNEEYRISESIGGDADVTDDQ